MSEVALVYVILGLRGSGRSAIIEDLVKHGFDQDERGVLCCHQEECGLLKRESIAELPQLAITPWCFDADKKIKTDLPLAEKNHVFFMTHGHLSPVEQMLALRDWISSMGLLIGRIFTVVNCQLLLEHSALGPWYEACIHFSDVVLLARREEVPQAWIKGFINKFQKEEYYPCLFEFVKKGRVLDPRALLYPESRRISQIFDERDAFDELELDPNNLPEEPFDVSVKEDPYFERLPSGAFSKPIPSVLDFLE